MTISKRELQLSQDLMDLQSRYNQLNEKYSAVLKDSREFRLLYNAVQEEIRVLKMEVGILKKPLPSVPTRAVKTRTSRAK